jgi:two-component system response regulator FixJ
MDFERTVYVVDDDPAVRRSLERLLDSAGFICVVYPDAPGFLEAVPQLSAGCVLLDVKMPETDGIELQARLSRLGLPLSVIMMTGHGDMPTAVQAMKAGALDVIEKPFDDESLIAAIEIALASAPQAARDREIAKAAERIARLSPRERQVLDRLVAGRQSKLIAYELRISVRTVEVHRARMLERLGTRRVAEAIRLAVLADLAPHNGRGANHLASSAGRSSSAHDNKAESRDAAGGSA